MNWIRIGLSDEQLNYIIRLYIDQRIETEKILNTNRLVQQKEEAKDLDSMAKEMWSGGKEVKPRVDRMGTDVIIGHADRDYENLKPVWNRRLRKSMKTQKRGKNGRFISTKRKRRT